LSSRRQRPNDRTARPPNNKTMRAVGAVLLDNQLPFRTTRHCHRPAVTKAEILYSFVGEGNRRGGVAGNRAASWLHHRRSMLTWRRFEFQLNEGAGLGNSEKTVVYPLGSKNIERGPFNFFETLLNVSTTNSVLL
jgi:hypothetical protein